MKARSLHTPDLADFILGSELNAILTDTCKSRILFQFLIRFRQEFDTELEFQEMLEAVMNQYKTCH